jgi:hypothetical protein
VLTRTLTDVGKTLKFSPPHTMQATVADCGGAVADHVAIRNRFLVWQVASCFLSNRLLEDELKECITGVISN